MYMLWGEQEEDEGWFEVARVNGKRRIVATTAETKSRNYLNHCREYSKVKSNLTNRIFARTVYANPGLELNHKWNCTDSHKIWNHIQSKRIDLHRWTYVVYANPGLESNRK